MRSLMRNGAHKRIFDAFRFVHQFYVQYMLNGIVRENVKDLQIMVNLHRLYNSATGNACHVITRLISDCDDSSGIYGLLDMNDDYDGVTQNDQMNVSIQSPKIVLHQQLKYVMQFINTYNRKNQLHCKIQSVKQEFVERKIISKEEDFDNVKALIDLKQFKVTRKHVTCISK
eukprot:245163_1